MTTFKVYTVGNHVAPVVVELPDNPTLLTTGQARELASALNRFADAWDGETE